MSEFDLSTLPAPLGAYFAADDHNSVAHLFDATATVIDEGETHRGPDAISAWLDRAETKYQPRYRVQAADIDDRLVVVSVEVSGTFPGSPALLKQAFTLTDTDLIERLETL